MSYAALSLYGLAALIIGYSKTAVGGLAVVSVAIFASLLPTRASTAAILMLLIVGDLFAVWHYRRHCDVALLKALLPSVLPGLALGAGFLAVVDDTVLRRSIGALLLVLAAVQLLVNARRDRLARLAHHRASSWAAGLGSGFATMTANAAGAVMTVYLVAKQVDKVRFIGTSAWFFLGINLAKVPFSIGLGLLTWTDVGRAMLLAPLIAVGAWLGVQTIRRISQRTFEILVLTASALSALALLVR
ncbi:sulfite exporter TauE/SafE family protein [Nostocoides sp.]|jgi:uncharacterized membrane protein YfcA|uniref:sulfite exporter TauE/SafE family protein n=1 Tax=Nostocoides sp. TaxID=1917966 RepID=UPI002C8E2E64|nr:sulfite exporter TauE/SafE family protein [Tetrasphaera sp.]